MNHHCSVTTPTTHVGRRVVGRGLAAMVPSGVCVTPTRRAVHGRRTLSARRGRCSNTHRHVHGGSAWRGCRNFLFCQPPMLLPARHRVRQTNPCCKQLATIIDGVLTNPSDNADTDNTDKTCLVKDLTPATTTSSTTTTTTSVEPTTTTNPDCAGNKGMCCESKNRS